jgi:hypothetical protein
MGQPANTAERIPCTVEKCFTLLQHSLQGVLTAEGMLLLVGLVLFLLPPPPPSGIRICQLASTKHCLQIATNLVGMHPRPSNEKLPSNKPQVGSNSTRISPNGCTVHHVSEEEINALLMDIGTVEKAVGT